MGGGWRGGRRSVLRQDSLCGLPALSGPGAAADAAAAASELSALVPGPTVRESCRVCVLAPIHAQTQCQHARVGCNSAQIIACLGVCQVKTMVTICQEQQLWQSHRA